METGSGLGPASESGGSSAESSLSGGLKFGQKIYFEDSSGGGSGGGSGSSGPGSSSGSGRKTRGGGPGQAGQPPRCQVEGCRVDLSNVKAYYSRHKVCAMHSKSPTVIVAGLEQRFCQQCSRFHQLPEFDQEKRSCRRRLAGHNERRRKPQHSSLLTSRYGRISPSLLGNASTVTSGNFLVDSTAWPPARASDVSSIRRPLSSPPWQIHPENHPLNIFPQVSVSGGTRFSCPEMMNPRAESYKGVADSSCALSLLSNQQPQAPPLSPTWRASSGFNVMTLGQVSIAQPGPEFSRHQYSNPAWEFKSGDSISSSSHDMSPVLGLGQISEAANSQIGGNAAMGELSQNQQTRRLYMEPENSRAYDFSSQNINWPL